MNTRQITGWIISILPLSFFIFFINQIPLIVSGERLTFSFLWVPSLNFTLSFHLDGLSLLFSLLITGIGTLIIIYGSEYLREHKNIIQFHVYTLLFMVSMLGVVLSDNIFSLFVFWELTSLSSFLLIGFENEKEKARSAALQALLVTSLGGLALLVGLVILSQVGGSAELSVLALLGSNIKSDPLYIPILILILSGAFTKSAQVPFHFWLPNAMEAPTPVSAYLHSATMVKAGVYLLARLNISLGGTEAWFTILTIVGVSTILVSAYLALTHTEIKRILAYSTISSLGTMVMLIGLGTNGAIKAVVVFLLAHAIYKAALFMLAGALYKKTGTLDLDQLGGLWRHMPITMILTGLAALSLFGIGPVLSFIGKELLLEAVLEIPNTWLILTLITVFSAVASVAIALILFIWPFFRTSNSSPASSHDPGFSLLFGPGLLAVSGVLLGLFPGSIANLIVEPAIFAILGVYQSAQLALWHGLNQTLAVSGAVFVLGFLLYRNWTHWRKICTKLDRYLRTGPAWLYDRSIAGLNYLANFQTNLLQSGHLSKYILIVISIYVLLVGFTLIFRTSYWPNLNWSEFRFYEVGLALLIIAATMTAITIRSRLAAIAALGVVGYGMALIFTFFGAPDLAMTQVMIETLTVILLVLVLYHLPEFTRLSTKKERLRDAILASAVGGLMTLFLLLGTSIQPFPPISRYYIENSVTLAHGRNIVNIILVEFRSLDTLGEITVLSLAGVGVFALLKLRLGKNGKDDS
ncbi:MAG: putative monovalent cation/H+ antiporter subunit A [Anaerolineales bacterium]|nr:putative monovalent cation/H+ antiporter subunit A [Anaerolineales bacterium]